MSFWDIFRRKQDTEARTWKPEETWTLKRFVRHQITCDVCKLGFENGEVVLQSSLGRIIHRRCRARIP